MEERFVHLNSWLKNKFGSRTLKICIDGGFSCPNRDGTCGKEGCIFCSEGGSGEHIKFKDIQSQVLGFLGSYRGQRAEKFIAYFQNFTNTYDSLDNLKFKYDSAFCSDKIVALAIATRPDCIDEDIVKLISSYKNKYYVWVELGLQTANDNTANLINRGYTTDVYTHAVQLLNKYDIDVVTHIMIGLPNETQDDLQNTVKFINNHKIKGLKIHSTYVVKNTKLATMYERGQYIPLELEEYIEKASFVLTHISPDIVIHRISGDAPKDLLIAPKWNAHKKWIMNGLDKYLRENNLYQGMYYNK